MLRKTSVSFKKVSLSDSRRVRPGSESPVEENVVDKYLKRPAHQEGMTLYEYIRKDGHVPLAEPQLRAILF